MVLPTFSLFAMFLLHATGGAAAATAKTGVVALPEGLPDGHYKSDGTINPKTGFTSYTYLGPIDHEAVANFTARRDIELVRRATVQCSGHDAGDSVWAVETGFASFWDQQVLNGHRIWAWTTQGSSRAL